MFGRVGPGSLRQATCARARNMRALRKLSGSSPSTSLNDLTQAGSNSGVASRPCSYLSAPATAPVQRESAQDSSFLAYPQLYGLLDSEQIVAASCSGRDEAGHSSSESWFGERRWTRAPRPGASGNTPSAQQSATSGQADGSTPTSASTHPPWRFSVMCYNVLADTYVSRVLLIMG